MTHGALFNGIGGFQLGAHWCGIKNVWHSEINKFCNKVVALRFPESENLGDIKNVTKETAGPVDIISGGFPCQPFSIAGKRKGKEDDRYLWKEMLKVISEFKPTWIIGENVTGIINMELDEVLADLASENYETQTFIIPACGVGALHRRNRVWIIAYNNNNGQRSGYLQKHSNKRRKQALIESCKILPNVPNTGKNRLQRILTESQTRGFFNRFFGKTKNGNYPFEPSLCRTTDGIPNRVDRIKSLGNAIVPQIAYVLFKAIMEVER